MIEIIALGFQSAYILTDLSFNSDTCSKDCIFFNLRSRILRNTQRIGKGAKRQTQIKTGNRKITCPILSYFPCSTNSFKGFAKAENFEVITIKNICNTVRKFYHSNLSLCHDNIFNFLPYFNFLS
ncbi:hypothetical protein ME7_00830 [Bartonella birtlesii LL-WM9]|uniref:Uncharacterized protein n=1 Tax=Bartonella birtlesii LL-WM9 TaxID=1094552 RepID=J0YPE3_9HYPH|nr:hypothetical protein ME7_00830 [Bartonella birtlesii LL-WM9]